MNLCKGCKETEVRQRNWWERLRHFCFRAFEEEVKDLRGEKFTEGFGQGYKTGFEAAKELGGRDGQLLLAIQDLTDEIKRPDSLNSRLTFDPKEVIEARRTPDGIKIFMGGEELTGAALTDLKVEADKLSRMKLSAIIGTKLRAIALEKAVNQSTKWEEVLAGKMMLHDLDVREAIVNALLETPSKQ